ncbi:MAG TPA: DUF72 domain-containing protein [candidate division Zixibacteria bacterium]|nr:DUF72 domain-containing protein [candidate division Zixibacteria bacterium]
MKRRRATFRVGTSGWHYAHWRGIFYPEDLPPARWFSHYAREFDTVEINNTFYRLPEAATFEAWRRQAPPGFCYALKFSRYGSHIVRLKRPRATIGRFLARATRLGEFLGPILVQLPPNWKADPGRLAAFLKAAPKQLRWAVELRDPRWLCEDVFAALEEHAAALCIHDLIADHPRRLTASWTYLRFHGDRYSGSYSPRRLRAEAGWIRDRLEEGRDVFAYFNNDAEGYAVRNAADLRAYVTGR